mmetsp:Transcript_9523/g.17382  ORF Transcript_9523/g.17382 Transcript_9523/m.17382 type:complete len:345 (-) Transcript_9523:1192-2226(-)
MAAATPPLFLAFCSIFLLSSPDSASKSSASLPRSRFFFPLPFAPAGAVFAAFAALTWATIAAGATWATLAIVAATFPLESAALATTGVTAAAAAAAAAAKFTFVGGAVTAGTAAVAAAAVAAEAAAAYFRLPEWPPFLSPRILLGHQSGSLFLLFVNQLNIWRCVSPVCLWSISFSVEVGYGYLRCSLNHFLSSSLAFLGSRARLLTFRSPVPVVTVVVGFGVTAGTAPGISTPTVPCGFGAAVVKNGALTAGTGTGRAEVAAPFASRTTGTGIETAVTEGGCFWLTLADCFTPPLVGAAGGLGVTLMAGTVCGMLCGGIGIELMKLGEVGSIGGGLKCPAMTP